MLVISDGAFGYTVRVLPAHPELADKAELAARSEFLSAHVVSQRNCRCMCGCPTRWPDRRLSQH